jgi:vacuolar-type H+-ATPase subunit C/Vma6
LSQEQLYSNVLVKIGVERSNLLSKEKLQRLTDSNSLTELITELRTTIYGEKLSKLTTPYSTDDLERAFRETFIEVCIKMVKNSPLTVSAFLKTYLLKFEHENIKTILRAISVGLPYDDIKNKLYMSVEKSLKREEVFLKAAMALQVKLAVEALQHTIYGPLLSSGLQKYEETGSTKYFDLLLDKMFYEEFGKNFHNMPKNEQQLAFYYVSTKTEMFNILTILRAKLLGYDSHWIRVALSRDFYTISEQTIESMLMAEDFKSAMEVVEQTHYKKLFAKAETPEKTVSDAEKALKQEIFEHAQTTKIGDPFNVGSVMAFIMRKEIELYNLTMISLGTEYKWKKDDILNRLFF